MPKELRSANEAEEKSGAFGGIKVSISWPTGPCQAAGAEVRGSRNGLDRMITYSSWLLVWSLKERLNQIILKYKPGTF